MQTVPITTEIVSSNLDQGEVYNIKNKLRVVAVLGALYFIQYHRNILVMYDVIWWNFTK